mmetsp:Transcript_91983/g.192327  ORF Transcript_91983/g.192327 Transcript_91983/m.192327 type:complete len:223 (-) Transcript_91983:166-834(-)
MLSEIAQGGGRAEKDQQEGQRQCHGHQNPLPPWDSRSHLWPSVVEEPQVHGDGHEETADRCEGCSQKVHGIAEERDEVGEHPDPRKQHDADEIPEYPRSPTLFNPRNISPQPSGKAEEKHPRDNDAFDDIRDEHVDQQAESRQSDRKIEGQVVVDHTPGLVSEVVVATETSDHESCQLERGGLMDIGPRELVRLLHFRYNFDQHELRSHTESKRTEAREHFR